MKFCHAAVPDLIQDSAPSLSVVPHESLRLERLQEPREEERDGLGAVPEVVDVRPHAGDDHVGEGVVTGEAGYYVRAALKTKSRAMMSIRNILNNVICQ